MDTPGRPPSNIDPRREFRTRAGLRRGPRKIAASPRPGIGARAENATSGRVRRVGTSGVRASRKHTAGRGQVGPRTGDGRAVVLLILGRRGATHPRRGRASWREVTSSPRRRGPPRRLSFRPSSFFFTAARPKPANPDFSPTSPTFPPHARDREFSFPARGVVRSRPVGVCRGRRPRHHRDVGTNASW